MVESKTPFVGVVGTGIYLPKKTRSASEIAALTNGVWTAEAVEEKLGIRAIYLPGEEDGTQAMAAYAAQDLLDRHAIDPLSIDVILSIGEEWKEYPLTTSALFVQDQIGALNAWGIDVANRCSTGVSALKMAKDMLIADDDIHRILVVGGYRNGDFVDYTDRHMSMMYNLSAGGGAILLEKNYPHNILLGSHIIADGSLARTAGVKYGGTKHPITKDNVDVAYKSLQLMEPEKMKNRLNDVSMPNWFKCIDEALRKSDLTRQDIDYLAILHIKRSGHLAMLDTLGLTEAQTTYLEDYGHMGQIDQILSLHLALNKGTIKAGDHVVMIAAGIGYVWGANVIEWGPLRD